MKNTYFKYVSILKAVSDETRLKIIDMLSCGELCACQILEGLNITQPTLSYHMKILVESGLVNGERNGAWMRYTLNKKKTDEILSFLSDITSKKEGCICAGCSDANTKDEEGN
ncbi:MAG: transcriptional regulator [Firmicutes bacterium HGW-Firmicutes-13]|nr:MAG: transcriptional regulator [Firmicutes bacterium HGW-Firmicutes-13]